MANPSESRNLSAGPQIQSEPRPIVLRVPLTQEQRYAILKYTGKSASTMEFTEDGLRNLARSNPDYVKIVP